MSHSGHDDNKCGVNHHPCRTLSYTLKQRAKDDDVIQINGQDGTPYPMKKQHLVLRNITLIGTEGRARIAGEFSVVGGYLFADVARGLYTPPEQVSINLVNLELIRIGTIKLKNTLTTLNVQVVNCTVSKLSKSYIVDSSAAKTTVILKKSIIRHISKGLQVKSREFSLNIESSKIDNSGGSYPGQDCPQFIVTDDFESLVAHFSKSSFKYTFLIDLAASRKNKSNVNIIDSIFDDDSKNFKYNGCFSGITLRNTTALIVNSSFTNIISRNSLIKAIASFVTFKQCIFSNISSKLGMFSLFSSSIATFNKTNPIYKNLNGFNHGSVYLRSTKGIFHNCTFHNSTVNGQYGKGGAISAVDNSRLQVQQCLFKENKATYFGGAINIQKSQSLFINCAFERNTVKSFIQKRTYGGAICASSNSHLKVHQCHFKDNMATYGGGAIFMDETRSSYKACIFSTNMVKHPIQKETYGGAICAINNSYLTMHGCVLKENKATYYGGATHFLESESSFESCLFERNSVKSLKHKETSGGGAIGANGAGTNTTIKRCLFKENKAVDNGGAIFIAVSRSLLLKNCTFESNMVRNLTRKEARGGAIFSFDNSDMTVQQCLFKENTATYSGGAIAMEKTRGSFVNCTFERNSVKSRLQNGDFGGAICAIGTSYLTMRQCIFKQNTATYSGGATYIQKSESLFQSCIFERNKVNSLRQNTFGGAISATDAGTNITIKQCLFKENKAAGSGGAIGIAVSGSLLLKNYTFEWNMVRNLTGKKASGEAIFSWDNLNMTVQQCLFKENTAAYSGGAIHMIKTRASFGNCTFVGNSVKSRLQNGDFGGAICAIGTSYLTMHQCTFKQNTATNSGGATYIQKSESSFESCIFERNRVISLQLDTFGGAISANGASTNITIKQCLFKENKAAGSGGALGIAVSGSLLLKNCTFESNMVRNLTRKEARGGAIFSLDNSDMTVQQCLFKENTATYCGGAIAMEKTRGSFVNCTFERNSVKSRLQNGDFGGAICAIGTSYLTMRQCIFKQNAATNSGGATYIQKSESLFQSCIFERNKAISLQLDTFGRAIGANGAGTNITIKQCLFKENKAASSGGAIGIAVSGSLLLKNCTFERNMARNLTGNNASGGAIFSGDNSDMIVQQCLFKENTAAYSGGAIHMIKTRASFGNCTFVGNSVKSHLQNGDFGGTICAIGTSYLTMRQCIFKQNTATNSGGATYIQKSESLFESCIFERNKVRSLQLDTFGGAIGANGASTNITIKQCLFKENKAVGSGGAIGIAVSGSLLLKNCTFLRNMARNLTGNNASGGAIFSGDNSDMIVQQCLFKENTAAYSGGAIHMIKTRASFGNCTFVGNSVKSHLQNGDFGGAICGIGTSYLTMRQCIFKQNTATNSGGATYIQKSESLFESCIFERNKLISLQLDTFGGAIGANGASTNITIKQCLFKENKAVGSCGAIGIAVSGSLLLKNCTFIRNMVRNLTGNNASGGAIFSGDNSDMIVQQCLFKENTAAYSGGAIHMIKTRASFGNCTFIGNSVKSRLQNGDFGGAICALGTSYLTMRQCIFKQNTATNSGGATYIQKSESLFESCIFERNKAINLQLDTFGGAIGANGASTNITIKQCLFKENKAVGSGGAIFIAVSRSLLLKNCTFERNMVRNLTRKKARGGAIFSLDNSDMTVQQCLFKENTAAYSGGAIHMIKTRGSFGNCTFVGNSVKNLQGITFGGAISSENGSSYLMEQCLFNDVMAVT